MNLLENKRILFISPRFFNYEVSIKEKLEVLGANVSFYDERPNNKTSTKVILRLFRKGLNKAVNKHYKNILNEINGKEFNFLFILKGESTPSFFLEQFKIKNPKAQLIFYSYDSLKNNSNAKFNFKYFDSAFSFDKQDVDEHPILKFRPLFFSDEYSFKGQIENKYDISFIGTAHSDRYSLVKKILLKLKESKPALKSYSFFYCQSRWYYRFRKVFDKDFHTVNVADLSFISLDVREVSRIFSESKCIIDIQHPNQTGLTMRTFEALGSRKKIITTNKEILSYDFYDSRNILIVDRRAPTVSPAFLLTDYIEIDHEILERYTLRNWIAEVFGLHQNTEGI